MFITQNEGEAKSYLFPEGFIAEEILLEYPIDTDPQVLHLTHASKKTHQLCTHPNPEDFYTGSLIGTDPRHPRLAQGSIKHVTFTPLLHIRQ